MAARTDGVVFDGQGHDGGHVDVAAGAIQAPFVKWLGRLGRWLSFRSQVLLAIALINLVAAVFAAVVVIYNAQRAAEVEIAASMKLAEGVVRESIERSGWERAGTDLLDHLSRELRGLRHVSVLVTGPGGSWASMVPPEPAASGEEEAPKWFSSLVNVDKVRREIKIGLEGRYIGSVILTGRGDDEIAEVWHDTRDLVAVAIVLNLTVLGVLYVVLGRMLQPLTRVATGLRELERGRYRHHLPVPGVRELADITDGFNSLAERLAAARTDNERLTRRLVTAQDDERRHIATELHDEMGPCLFGIKANVASLERLVGDVPAPTAALMKNRVATLAEITDSLQSLNRRLLGSIHPMALGRAPLSDVITGLMADLGRHPAAPALSSTFGRLAYGYGDSVDLTVYRCVQEGITNALRHAGAANVSVELNELRPDNEEDAGVSKLSIAIRDDGRGMPDRMSYGFGLSGMEERVRALGGTFTVAGGPGKGTSVEISIPLRHHGVGSHGGGPESRND